MPNAPLTLPASCGGILAGGEGRRFGGQDKGWIPYRGHSFIEEILLRLRPQLPQIVISANRHQHRYAALGHPVVGDRLGAGPLAGLLRLLETASEPFLLSVPCDALGLPDDVADRLRSAQARSGADLVVLADDDGVIPTAALTRAALAPDLEAFLESGGRKVRDWQARQAPVVERMPGRLLNVNDAEALALIEAQLESQSLSPPGRGARGEGLAEREESPHG